MKLYNAQLSPFAARCRLSIYAKGVDVEMIDVGPGAVPPELDTLTPMHKVPLLVHGDVVVPESETICEYLEDLNLGASLRPEGAAAMAHMRLLARIGDLYIMEPMGELFGQINPQGRDQALVDREMAELVKGIGWLEHYLDGSPFAVGDRLSLADCALVPMLFFFDRIGPMFGEASPLKKFPSTNAYYQGIQNHPAAARVIAELDAALRRMMGS
ncbi:MAG: glutathione S-transferase family protein [Parvibaculum sp.]|uniref:glutathione S-transferase family protein n=1 Tax=Parvibaculum sp. TaxID=2024848 RepID=UPI0027221A5F|nr:glutathione S-transferase family protein [Parvibaculum sp.]MDO8838807.1 glutathione S-transferase family protein [Parvibaculum sp.]